MPRIFFAQYLPPNGEARVIQIDRPANVCAKADAIIAAGFSLCSEILTTGQVAFTISDQDDDYAIQVCANGPGIPPTVDRLILGFEIARHLLNRRIA